MPTYELTLAALSDAMERYDDLHQIMEAITELSVDMYALANLGGFKVDLDGCFRRQVPGEFYELFQRHAPTKSEDKTLLQATG